ncbi:unnamed protein product [Adineta steineri]|uniref:THO complex subunit 2 n=1 Tax=Adineta steineri TaxID=433720 RepID=A0A818G7P2_9BILA|nr:unnamed protein product [Adineta steineri]CAF3485467.1 unnamed protein product [Adineta steineri]
MGSKDYYAILGVNQLASDDEIKRAYKQKALKHHPDKNRGDVDAEKKFMDISEAYEILSDPYKRSLYDRFGSEELRNYLGTDPRTHFRSSGNHYPDYGATDPNSDYTYDPYNNYFVRYKDPTTFYDLYVTLEEVNKGATRKMKITRKRFNAEHNTTVRDEKLLEIQIKPGWKEGTKITFEGEGDEGDENTIAGDIVFIIRDKPHPIFERSNSDLIYRVKLNIKQALLGTLIVIPFLDTNKPPYQLRSHQEIVTPQTEKRFLNEGLPYPKDPSRRGDLIVKFDILFPKILSNEQRTLVDCCFSNSIDSYLPYNSVLHTTIIEQTQQQQQQPAPPPPPSQPPPPPPPPPPQAQPSQQPPPPPQSQPPQSNSQSHQHQHQHQHQQSQQQQQSTSLPQQPQVSPPQPRSGPNFTSTGPLKHQNAPPNNNTATNNSNTQYQKVFNRYVNRNGHQKSPSSPIKNPNKIKISPVRASVPVPPPAPPSSPATSVDRIMVEMQENRSIDISNTINTVITNWSSGGRNQFNELYKQLLEDNKNKYEAELALKQLLLSLCKSCLQGSQLVETIIPIFTELQETVTTPEIIGDLLADILATLDVELFPNDDTTTKETYKQRFFQLINKSEHIVSTTLLMERLEIDTLEYLDLIISRDQFNQKYVRIKTRLYYKQQKFNLLREESEGFAKTITELNQNFSITKLNSQQLYDRLMALIGYFDIDPNRVLDLVIESFECHLEYTKIYVGLLHLLHFDRLTLCQLIGFKFQQYQLQEDTASSLYFLAAQLVSNKLIELEDLLPHLYPLITDFSDNYTKEVESARGPKKSSTSTDTINKSKDSNTLKSNNQLLHFIQALLSIGDLEHALFLFDNLPRWSCTSYREINTLLTKLIAYIIDPLYKNNSDLHACFLQYELHNPLNSTVCSRELKLINTWNEFRENIFPLLLHLGAYCQDRLLFMKLTRLCTNLIKKSINADEQQEDILLLIDEVLFPSLSLLDVNGCLSIELWALIKLFPYDIRYGLYGRWHEETYRKTPQLIFVKQDVADKSRAILKRITKDNVKTYSRQIAKITHNNPIVILSVIMDQIQRYDNFITVINDALKYLSSLAYDIVCYTISRSLTSVSPDSLSAYIDGKMSRENATPVQSFQNLCVFSANVFKKYPIDFTSVLYYIYDQLRVEKTCDLYLLREIITKMSGVEVSQTITREQLEAASGGELLRNEAGQFTAARNVKKPSIRLKEALLDNHLYLPLSIIIAQQRSCIIFKFGAQRIEHLKLIGSLYDQCQDTMVQFFTFLSNVLTTENFHHKFPSIDDLVLGFHLQVDAAFHISRPLFNLNIQSKFDELRSATTTTLNRTAMIEKYIEAVTVVMSPVLDFVKTLHPQRTWEEMTPQFYLTFWSLSMSDLQVPEPAYIRRVKLLELEMTKIDEKELTAGKKRKEKEKIHIIIDKLHEELAKQKEHVERVRARLDKEREHWFKNRNKTKAETITEFLQLCIFPRCLLSEIDALYCAHFIRVIHDLVTPNFSTIICYDRLFSDISYSLASCSENEAIRYGRFLQSLLETVMTWHGDRNKFDQECASHPGFLTVFRNAGNAASKTTGTTQTPEQLDYDNFRHVCHKWHYKLAKSFIVCLDSNDYIQIRNVLQVLTVLLPIYPKMTTFYAALERRIKSICVAEKDRRHDLFALAKCYSGRLANKHRDMIEEGQFHSVPERSTPSSTSSNSNNNNNNNSAGTNMNPIVTPTIGDTNNVIDHPILSDSQSSQSSTTRSTAKESSSSSTTARSSNDKTVNAAGTSNGTTTSQKSSSPVPSSQSTAPTTATSTTSRSATINNTERTTRSKHEHVPTNSSSNTNATTTTTAPTTSLTRSNRIPLGPTLPSSTPASKPQVTSTTQNKNESSETTTTTGGRTIKLPNNGTDRHESSQAPTVSTTRESPPTTRKESSTASDRRTATSSTNEPQLSSTKTSASPSSRTSSSRTFTTSTRNVTAAGNNTDDSIRRSDQTATNGANNVSSKTTRTESPHENAPVEKRSRGGSSKGDRSTTSHVEESRNGSSRSAHRDHKHESNKRARSTTPDKRSSNGSGSSTSTRRLNQTAESTLSTTPVHQDNDYSSSLGVVDVSPSSLSSKRIKTSDTVSNGRSARKEAREDRHAASSSHRVSSSSSRSERREK